ncbi:unnamed protein product [Brugia timori]|uniref:Transmembrane protein n=1 Tax=Brugia timori TaxID=42155 RepID=A0A3P7WT14_9BILA|nr:unnamed protein product [Brugia timori]
MQRVIRIFSHIINDISTGIPKSSSFLIDNIDVLNLRQIYFDGKCRSLFFRFFCRPVRGSKPTASARRLCAPVIPFLFLCLLFLSALFSKTFAFRCFIFFFRILFLLRAFFVFFVLRCLCHFHRVTSVAPVGS